jgi:Carboxypeptidase regulatory-like domain
VTLPVQKGESARKEKGPATMHTNIVRASRFWKICTLFVCGLLFTLSVAGQSFYGSILGTVTDSSGSALPGATVTLTSTESGFKRSSTTGDDGVFTFLSLVPGTYTVAIEKMGFKTYARNSITIEVQATVRVDVRGLRG